MHKRREQRDEAWEQALDWLLRVQAEPDNAALKTQLREWLALSRSHTDAFIEACRVWDATGLIEPQYQTLWQNEPAAAPAAPDVVVPITDSPRSIFRRSKAPAWLGVAAALLLAVFYPQLRLWAQSDFQAAAGERPQLTLEDGSVVQLNSGSAISVDFDADERRVTLLEGEAFFNVTPQLQRPFLVEAGDIRVRVVGTRFNVRREPGKVAVEVEHGRVAVGGGRSIQEAQLAAGDWLSISERGETLAQGDKSPAAIASWRGGQLIVDDWTVAEAAAEIGRYRSGLVLVTDRQLAAAPISGVFNVAEPVAALRALVQPFGGQVQELGPLVLVSAQ